MGPKITVDSATMMNKGLEVMRHIISSTFRTTTYASQCRQSVVHGGVLFEDGSVVLHAALPDMRLPIAYGLLCPERVDVGARPVPFDGSSWTFEEPRDDLFRCLPLAVEAGPGRRRLPRGAQRGQRGGRRGLSRAEGRVLADSRGDRGRARRSARLRDAGAEAIEGVDAWAREEPHVGWWPPMTVVVAILGLIFLVIIHELGHMLTAKALGVRVPEFGIGFQPPIFKRKIGKTVYSFRIFLLGGFAKMAGMNDGAQRPDTFPAKAAWRRALIIFARPHRQSMAAVAILAVVLMTTGAVTGVKPEVRQIEPNSMAERVGIQPETGSSPWTVPGSRAGMNSSARSESVQERDQRHRRAGRAGRPLQGSSALTKQPGCRARRRQAGGRDDHLRAVRGREHGGWAGGEGYGAPRRLRWGSNHRR